MIIKNTTPPSSKLNLVHPFLQAHIQVHPLDAPQAVMFMARLGTGSWNWVQLGTGPFVHAARICEHGNCVKPEKTQTAYILLV